MGEGDFEQEDFVKLQCFRSTIRDYLERAERASLSWPLPLDLDDDGLEAKLFPTGKNRGHNTYYFKGAN